ncbi:MAG: hypothetical protein LC112_12390 [Flavobacteriales bacterium]|nr:hypothetical protein [Flavobacteriales bacterium]
MKIKHLLVINVFFIIIILFNFVFKNDNKKYIFPRNFTENKIQVVKKYDLSNIKYFTASSDFIAIYSKQLNTENHFVVGKLLDLNENITENSTFKFSINPKFNPVILNISKNFLLYTQKWNLYINNILVNDKIKVVNALFYRESQILFLGEYQDKEGFVFGFFLLDLKSKVIKKIHTISNDSQSHFPKYFLQYEGNFKIYGNKMVYVNKKSSNVWVIENNKASEFKTEDKTPLPSIINSDDNYYYERGKTYNANPNFFLTEKYVCVFSSRTENKAKIIIDFYKYNGKYVNSYEVPIKGESVQNIINVYSNKNFVAVAFVNEIILLK